MFRVKYYIDWDEDLRKYMSTKEYTVFAVNSDKVENTLFLVYDFHWCWIDSERCEPIV